MKSLKTSIQILSGECFLEGLIDTKGKRLLDLLQDSYSDSLQFEKISIRPRSELVHSLGRFQAGYVPKEKVDLIILPVEDERDPVQRRYKQSQTQFAQGAVVLPNCIVEGRLHGMRRIADAAGTCITQLPTFFPITSARILMSDLPEIHASTIIINKNSVCGIVEGPIEPSEPHEISREEIDEVSQIFSH